MKPQPRLQGLGAPTLWNLRPGLAPEGVRLLRPLGRCEWLAQLVSGWKAKSLMIAASARISSGELRLRAPLLIKTNKVKWFLDLKAGCQEAAGPRLQVGSQKPPPPPQGASAGRGRRGASGDEGGEEEGTGCLRASHGPPGGAQQSCPEGLWEVTGPIGQQ